MPATFGYWDVRGLAEPIRFMLHHIGKDFEDKKYLLGPGPEFNRSEWTEVKPTLGLDFPNLPYYIDGDVKITQSFAIIKHLARTNGLFPTNEADITIGETVEQLTRDVTMGIVMYGLATGAPQAMKDMGKQRVKESLDLFSNYLGDRQWFVGNKLTYVDFLVFEAIEHQSYMFPDTFVKFPNLGQFRKRILGLPNVKKYVESGDFKAWPLYGPYVSWGGSGEAPAREGV